MITQTQAAYIATGTDAVFTASTQSGIACSLALSTTQTGFTLTNPAGSPVNLVLLHIDAAFTSAPAGVATLVLTANTNPLAAAVTQTTALTVRDAKLGNATAAVGLAARAVTLPAQPSVIMGLGGPVASSSLTPEPIHVAINGGVHVTPGCCVNVSALTTAISAVISMIWAEVPAF